MTPLYKNQQKIGPKTKCYLTSRKYQTEKTGRDKETGLGGGFN